MMFIQLLSLIRITDRNFNDCSLRVIGCGGINVDVLQSIQYKGILVKAIISKDN